MSSSSGDDATFRPYHHIDDIFEFCGRDFYPAGFGVEFVDDYTLVMDCSDADEVVVTR
jgi:hypothetical protein